MRQWQTVAFLQSCKIFLIFALQLSARRQKSVTYFKIKFQFEMLACYLQNSQCPDLSYKMERIKINSKLNYVKENIPKLFLLYSLDV